jgi:hypothetical protein
MEPHINHLEAVVVAARVNMVASIARVTRVVDALVR